MSDSRSNSRVSTRSLVSPSSSPKEDSDRSSGTDFTTLQQTGASLYEGDKYPPNLIPFPTRALVERRKPIKYIFPDIGPDLLSSHHSMIPKHYVPPWQLDMKNRYHIIENCQSSGVKTCWGGHISYFWEGRERLNATSHEPYYHLSDQSKRKCFSFSSHLSKYNPSQMYYY